MTFRVGIIFRSWPGQNNKNSREYPRDDHDEEADDNEDGDGNGDGDDDHEHHEDHE